MTGTLDGSIAISDVMWSLDENGSQVNGPAPQAFSSRHNGGAYFALCDGSVRFLAAKGDAAALKWLAGRNDGQVVPGDF